QVDSRRVALGPVRRRPVGGHVERLVLLAGVVEAVRKREPMRQTEIHIGLEQQRSRLNRMANGLSFVLGELRLKEVEKRHALAVARSGDEPFVVRKRGGRNRAGCADGDAQIRPLKIAGDAFDRAEEEGLIRLDWSTERSAELFTVKVGELG